MRRAVILVAERRASRGVKEHFVTKRWSSWWRVRPQDVPRAGAAESEPLCSFSWWEGRWGGEGNGEGIWEGGLTKQYQSPPP